MRMLFNLLLAAQFFTANCFAQITAPSDYTSGPSAGSEYFVGKELGKPLITVNLLNGVTRPGVYHVPIQTNLPQLIAYAGGALPSVDTSEVRIRRVDREKSLYLERDLDKIIVKNEPFPVLTDKDIVQIRERNNLDGLMKWISLFSAISVTTLSVVLIDQNLRN